MKPIEQKEIVVTKWMTDFGTTCDSEAECLVTEAAEYEYIYRTLLHKCSPNEEKFLQKIIEGITLAKNLRVYQNNADKSLVKFIERIQEPPLLF